jgi:hypothetical protein
VTTTVGPMTVRYLLLGADHAEIEDVLASTVGKGGVAATVGQALGGIGEAGQKVVCQEVAHVADSLLDADVSAVLVHAWRKNQLISAACQRTAAHPNSEELVELATHKIRSSHRPCVEVFVDDVLITTVDLTLSLTFVIHGLLVVIRGGQIAAVRSGTCDATAALDCESVRLADSTLTFDIPGTIRSHPERLRTQPRR